MSSSITDVEEEPAVLDEVEAIMDEMRPDENLYAYTKREPEKGAVLLRWLLKTVAETSAKCSTPGRAGSLGSE